MTNNPTNVLETLESLGNFSSFTKIIYTAKLEDFFAVKQSLTLFVPDDESFALLRTDVLDYLLNPEYNERLESAILYHVIQGRALLLADLIDRDVMTMANGDTLMVNFAHDKQLVFAKGTSTMKSNDIHASNGVIHTLNKLMVPK